jgi:hypothetical protein
MTEQDKAFEIIKRIRRTKEMSEREAINLALVTVDEVNDLLWDLEPLVDEDLWLYRELKAKIPYWKGVKNALKKL